MERLDLLNAAARSQRGLEFVDRGRFRHRRTMSAAG
jgi:hypothetical protein